MKTPVIIMHIIQRTTRKSSVGACIDHTVYEACVLYIVDNSTTQDNIIL